MEIKDHNGKITSTSADIAVLIHSIISATEEYEQDKEHFFCIGLNVKNRVKYIDLVSLGTLTNCLVHPREVFRLAVMRGVASIICAHNHPGGDPEPSREDFAVTKKLKEAGETLGIKVIDHVIIGNGTEGYVSMLEKGYL